MEVLNKLPDLTIIIPIQNYISRKINSAIHGLEFHVLFSLKLMLIDQNYYKCKRKAHSLLKN